MGLPKGLNVVDFNQYVIAKLYNTRIVEVDESTGSVVLRNGGWPTKHTKKCMNLVLNDFNIYVCQEKFIWNVYKNGSKIGSFDNNGEFRHPSLAS